MAELPSDEHKRSERRLTSQHAATRVLAEAATLAEAAPQILGAIGEALGWAGSGASLHGQNAPRPRLARVAQLLTQTTYCVSLKQLNHRAGKKPLDNFQLYIAVGLPIIAVLASLTVSMFQISGVRGEISGVRGEISGVRGEISGIRMEFKADLNQLRSETRADLSDVRAEIRGLRGDIQLLTGKVIELMDKS